MINNRRSQQRFQQKKKDNSLLNIFELLRNINQVESFSFEPMNERCTYCQALYFKEEANKNGYNKCCKKGRINFVFEDDRPYPEPLFQMMVNPLNEYHGDFH